ncbi:MAG TPA: YIP1 family protein [Vicinamibacterales bacterium]|nr:YIP1 family protein [Vicinamibacterales bacterium]
MASFQERVVGVMRLQAATFEEVEHDANATAQAAIVVLAVTIASSLVVLDLGVTLFLGTILAGLIRWVAGAFVVWIIGTRLLPGRNTEGDFTQVMRTIGFAHAPGIFAVLWIIPIIGWLIALAASIWALIATVIGVRQALDYDDTLRAVIVCVIAWIVMVLVMMVASLIGLGARVW